MVFLVPIRHLWSFLCHDVALAGRWAGKHVAWRWPRVFAVLYFLEHFGNEFGITDGCREDE